MKKFIQTLLVFFTVYSSGFALGDKKTVFLGHTSPDSDSILSALAAAHYYDGQAVRAGELNNETRYVLKRFGLTEPEAVEKFKEENVFLIDFNQNTQLHSSVSLDRIVGIIDHHALREATIIKNTPIHIDIEPWGCSSTLLTLKYFKKNNRKIPRNIAGAMLAAILSDTLNLASATTTDYDREAVALLSPIAGVKNSTELYNKMAEAKSDISGKSMKEILLGDFKKFKINSKKIGFAVAESIVPERILSLKVDLQKVLQDERKAQGLDYLFFVVVDTKNIKGYLLKSNGEEDKLAGKAYSGTFEGDWMKIGNNISRKKQLIPQLEKVIGI